MVERASSSEAPAEVQPTTATARVSVMDRLGPMPAQAREVKRGRDRSAEGGRRGRKKSTEDKAARVPVHERLGPMHPPQAFKKNELFQKRNRQQVWRQEEVWRPPLVYTREKPEEKTSPPAVKPAPVVKSFDAAQHRQAWTWTRPKADASETAMDTDE